MLQNSLLIMIVNNNRLSIAHWKQPRNLSFSLEGVSKAYHAKVEKIIIATVALPNHLQHRNNVNYTLRGFVGSKEKSKEITEGQMGTEIYNNSLKNVNRFRNSPYSNSALQTQEILWKNLMNEGSTPWQLKYIRRTRNE